MRLKHKKAKFDLKRHVELRLMQKYKKAIIIISWVPFRYIDLSSIEITEKGKAFMAFLDEDPNNTYEDFQARWQQMWGR